MAGIMTSLGIYDRMTSVLNKQLSGVNKLIAGMKSLDAATKAASPSTTFQRTTESVKAATNSVDKFQSQQNRAAAGASNVKSSWSGAASLIRTAVTALASAQFIKLTFGGALDLDSAEREFQARMGNDSVGSAMFDKLQQQAQKSAFGFKELANNTLSFMSMTTNPSNLDGLNNLAEKLAVFDKTGQGLAGAGFSIKEAMSGDIVSLAERFNMSKAQIRGFGIDQMGKNGDVEGFIRQFNLLLEAQNMGEAAYQKMLQSPKVQLNMFLSNLKTGFAMAAQSALQSLTPLITRLNAWFSSDSGQAFFAGLSAGLNQVVVGVMWLVDGISWLAGIIQANWSVVQPILAAIAITYLGIMVTNLVRAAAAWLVMNWPILAIVAAIAGLIWFLNKMGVTVEDVVGFVTGTFSALGAFSYDLIAYFANQWITFAEFFANLFNDPVYTVKRLFVNMANTVLEALMGIAEGMDQVFGSNLAQGMVDLQNRMDEWLGEMPEGYKVINRLEMKSLSAAYENGKSWGVNATKSIEGMLADASAAMSTGTDTSALAGWEGANIATVGEVGSIKNDVHIADEDIQMLRDAAETRFVARYQLMNPQLTVQIDTVEKTADIDEVMDSLSTRLDEMAYASAEGVHV